MKRAFGVTSGLVFFVLPTLLGNAVPGAALMAQEEKPKAAAADKGPKNPGINVLGKNGVLEIDGTNGREIQIKTKLWEMELSQFEKIAPGKDIHGFSHDGVCFFVKMKNLSDKKTVFKTSDNCSTIQQSIFRSSTEQGSKLNCTIRHTWISINGFPYNPFPQETTLFPSGEYRDTLVFHPIDSTTKKISVAVNLPLEATANEFQIILRDLKK